MEQVLGEYSLLVQAVNSKFNKSFVANLHVGLLLFLIVCFTMHRFHDVRGAEKVGRAYDRALIFDKIYPIVKSIRPNLISEAAFIGAP